MDIIKTKAETKIVEKFADYENWSPQIGDVIIFEEFTITRTKKGFTLTDPNQGYSSYYNALISGSRRGEVLFYYEKPVIVEMQRGGFRTDKIHDKVLSFGHIIR